LIAMDPVLSWPSPWRGVARAANGMERISAEGVINRRPNRKLEAMVEMRLSFPRAG
jgi:hypothetical protein